MECEAPTFAGYERKVYKAGRQVTQTGHGRGLNDKERAALGVAADKLLTRTETVWQLKPPSNP